MYALCYKYIEKGRFLISGFESSGKKFIKLKDFHSCLPCCEITNIGIDYMLCMYFAVDF
jgi:hypothetical protein